MPEIKQKQVVGILIALAGLVLAINLLFVGSSREITVCVFIFLLITSGVALLIARFDSRREKVKDDQFVRGRSLITFDEAKKRALSLGTENRARIFWGGLNLPDWISTTHFLVTGGTGSGKTITTRLLMQSVLHQIRAGSDHRAMVYDGKQDVVSILYGMGLKARIEILNPFDKRSSAWDIAADIRSPAAAQQLARLLIPENPRASQPYFSDAARQLLKGVVVTLMKRTGKEWTFRDLILSLKSETTLKAMFAGDSDTKALLRHFGNPQTGQNVMATLVSHVERYEIVAALWERAERRVSLEDWITGESILVLGNDERLRAAIDPINQALFERATELILSSSESGTRRTWIFLDEVREAGELRGLSKLLTKGRSKGACVVLGFQDLEGLRAVYGKEQANEIVGLCTNKAMLRTDDPETARWAAQVFGEKETVERRTSESSSSNHSGPFQKLNSTRGISKSVNEHLSKRDTLLASEFMTLPVCNPENGLSGRYLIPIVGGYSMTIPGEWISSTLNRASTTEPSFLSRDDNEQYLTPWSEAECNKILIKSSLDIIEDEPSKQTITQVCNLPGLHGLTTDDIDNSV